MMAVGGIWVIVKAFQESIWWGLACLLFSPASLIFVLTHWDDASKPFLIQLGGGDLMIVSVFMSAPPA